MYNTPKMGLKTAPKKIQDICIEVITSHVSEFYKPFKECINDVKDYFNDLSPSSDLGLLNELINSLENLYNNLESIMLDIYIFLRLFKTFKDKNSISQTIDNAIIFVGGGHKYNLIELMSKMNCKVKSEQRNKKPNIRCTSLKDSTPWFE